MVTAVILHVAPCPTLQTFLGSGPGRLTLLWLQFQDPGWEPLLSSMVAPRKAC